MEPKDKIIRNTHAKKGFTIVEILVVLSIIVILLSMLLPSMNMVRKYSKFVAQKNLFKNIDTGLQAFEIDSREYPDSSNSNHYCGAMKLAEAMAGQDGLGFNLNSKFTADDGSGQTELYPPAQSGPPYPDWYVENLRNRKEYLEPKDVRLCTLDDLYTNTGSFTNVDEVALLCDVFQAAKNLKTGRRSGMPILYYKANTSKLLNDTNSVNYPNNIYNYLDNQELLELGVPWDSTATHPLYEGASGVEGQVFYESILDKSALPIERPYNKDSYILISAGWDGIYGTRDDVFNFAQ